MWNTNLFNLFEKFSNAPIRPRPDDDYFQHTKMSFGDHIEDLRWHLIRAIVGFAVALCLSFFVGGWVMEWIKYPVQLQLQEFSIQRSLTKTDRNKREMGEMLERLGDNEEFRKAHPGLFGPKQLTLKIKAKDAEAVGLKAKGKDFVELRVEAPSDSELLEEYSAIFMTPRSSLVALEVQEVMMIWLQVCLVTALVISSPWIFYQIWSFIAAGLYPHEKRLVNYYLPASIVLFLGGVTFCYFLVIPRALGFLLEFNAWFDVEPQIRLTEWISFAIWVPVIFGVTFETPLVMFFLERLGVTSLVMYRSFRRYAWFILAIVAILINPTINVDTMMMMWIPLVGFYELGIALCALFPRKEWLDLEVPESEELIEV